MRYLLFTILINLLIINIGYNSKSLNITEKNGSVSYTSLNSNLEKGFDDSPIKLRKLNSKVPERFDLYQNFPNPFNPSTRIRFDIPDSRGTNTQSVTLVVYNIIRQKVVTLLNNKLKAGEYEIEWNASGYNSGVYFYQLSTRGTSKVKRMILVK